MKRFKTAALLVAALVASMGTSALAAPGDAPAGWTLVGSDTVRYFLPGTTPPAGGDLADATTAARIASQNPSSGEWLLVATDNVKDFIPDGGESASDELVSSTFVSTRNESRTYLIARSVKLLGEPTYDSPVRESDSKKWRLVSQTATIRRYEVPISQGVHTPYKIVDRSGHETRTVDTYDNTYRANKIVKTALGQEVVDTHTYTKREEKATAWARGPVDPALDRLLSQGVDDTVKVTYESYIVDLLAGKVTESDKAQSTKASTFLSDSGSGANKTALSGSKKRVAFKADEVVASAAKQANNGNSGSIQNPGVGNGGQGNSGQSNGNSGQSNGNSVNSAGNGTVSNVTSGTVSNTVNNVTSNTVNTAPTDPIAAVVGTWKLQGGGSSYFTIARAPEAGKIKVHFVISSAFGTFDKEWTGTYQPTWSVSHDGLTTTSQFNGNTFTLTVSSRLGSRSSTFVKQ